MDNLPTDTISIIFEYLDTKDLIRCTRTCWKFRNTFRKYIGKCKLNLNYCNQITDEGLKYLKGVHTIYLEYCNQLTDEGLKYLSGVQNINLRECNQITDEGLKYLAGVQKILKR